MYTLVALLSVGAASACRSKPEPAPTPVGPTAEELARLKADSIAAARAMQLRQDSIDAARRAANSRPVDNSAEIARTRTELLATLAQKVYFDYDQDSLRTEARAALDAKAAILTANGFISLVITGHTDERGTAEYNLALGQRRAAQVKRYLASKGVQEARLTTQSLGDSQPAVQGTDEASYQQNRRAEFEAQNVAGTLVRPRA
jgi:peptidoglycan-associated lipoprotein